MNANDTQFFSSQFPRHKALSYDSRASGGAEVSLIIIIFLVLWGFTVGTALIVARNRLDSPLVSLWDELLARGVAFMGASLALIGFGLAASMASTTTHVLIIVPPTWTLSVVPLFLPPLRRASGAIVVSSQNWIVVSVGVTVLGGLTISLSLLVRLILTGPELI